METAREDFPPALTRMARGEIESSRVGVAANTQSRSQSRIPQNSSSARKQSSSSNSRPPLTHESQYRSTSNLKAPRPIINTLRPVAPLAKDRDEDLSSKKIQPRRRIQPSAAQETPRMERPRANSGRTDSSSSIPRSQGSLDLQAQHFDRSITESPVEIQVAHKVGITRAIVEAPMIYPELDRYRGIRIPRDDSNTELLFRLATDNLPPPTPLFSGTSSHSQVSTFSGSPSTRFSESPGPGPYSRDTTPTSMSSASPGLIAPLRTTVRGRQPSPADIRPPVTRWRTASVSTEFDDLGVDADGLSVVAEGSTSCSSNSTSTVREMDRYDTKKTRRLSPHPPNPPPRKSSQKFLKGRPDEEESPLKSMRKQPQSAMRSPSPTRSNSVTRDNKQRAVTSPQPRPTPPSRPSRDGTPDLYSQYGRPVPIIHSNLSSTSLSEKRQSGQLAPSALPRSSTPSSSRDHSVPAKTSVTREATPAPRSSSTTGTQPAQGAGRATRSPSPNVGTFKSRFGFFGRRKTDTDVPTEKKERVPRKGPAAGTGHEGYGRTGAVRRRSSSNAANPARGLSGPTPSSDSLASLQSTDSFLLERINPVVIAGGEIIENRNTSSELSRTESNQSIPFSRPPIESRNGSSVSLSSRDETRNTLWSSALPRNPSRSRRPSDSSDSEAVTMKSTLAFRRSVHRLQSSEQKAMNLPKPLVTKGIKSPSVGSMDMAILTDDSLAVSQAESGPGRSKLASGPKKLTKRAKSPRKWNLFGRSQNQPHKGQKIEDTKPVKAAVTVVQTKPVAFYTMLNTSEQDDIGDLDMNEILREADVILPPPPESLRERQRRPSASSQRNEPTMAPKPTTGAHSRQQSISRPSVAQSGARPGDSKGPPKQVQSKAPAERPSRLPQVGRIPKVVTTRPEQTSPKSFSRPFHRISLQIPASSQPVSAQDFVAKGPSPPGPSTPELSQVSTATTGASGSPPRVLRHRQSRSLDLSQTGKEFLAFSPRKNSGYTTSSTSSSSGILSFAPHTAVIPPPSAPLVEDEIWDEYNDLLGDAPPSATSSKGIPFHLEAYETKSPKESKPLQSPTVNLEHVKAIRDSIENGRAATSSSHFSADMTARINAAFRFGSDPPSTPFSVSEFVSGYGDRNNSADMSKTITETERTSSSSSKAGHQARSSNSSTSSEDSPLSQVNLRVGSMTVSKWLTFGHVLFSPARDELVPAVGSLQRHSILVIDGLGNDDWSFYAAETYPAATFFNLSPRAPLPQEHRTSTSFPLSPPNHHQIQYTSHKEKLPFGPDSFTTVVFRFPAAAPEAHYRNIISEARRVLKPGGYVELSILDVDLNNMGNRCRRAVRRLKERINTQHPEINLSSTADLILRLLGKKGFVDVKSCRVGVPVASSITKVAGGEISKKKDERSLAEMMNDETELGDENITMMVAKVGRWWYNRLYELPTGATRSIWHDRALLNECEELKTSLKLMVCYAKVPETRSRVSSI
ncbi:hypothetical protein BX600DRAFT_381799 [Xylariales sp. PMI_506]|nr:hypothetical protein BX600DRAFT_381799 [Xylariales sp. PMI_506]